MLLLGTSVILAARGKYYTRKRQECTHIGTWQSEESDGNEEERDLNEISKTLKCIHSGMAAGCDRIPC